MNDKKFPYEKIAKLTDPERKKTLDPALIWKTIGLQAPEVMVDIGTGTGFFAMPFADMAPGAKIYACDISEMMLGWMRENMPPKYVGRVLPTSMGESSVPLPDGVADLVFMITLHHELNEPGVLLKESLRVLKPGGVIAIIDWKKIETPYGPPLEIRSTPEEVSAQLESAGFSGITVHDVLPWHFFVTAKKKG